MSKMMKLAGLNIGIVLVDIIIFSRGILNIQIGAGAFNTALGITVIFMSIVVFIFGNYKILSKEEKTVQIDEIKTVEDCIDALKQNYNKKTFKDDITTIIEQIERLNKKKETIKDILLQKFNSSEMSYSKFEGTILDVEKVFYLNIKSILNKLDAFDEADYNHTQNKNAQKKFSEEFVQNKLNIYNEYISFIKDAIEDNEEIILKLDRLLLEISKFNSLEDGEVENMSAMKEIDDLISKAKLYK